MISSKKIDCDLPPEHVAIVGMACIFPGAPDVKTYWQNIISKVNAISDPPSDWEAERFFDPGSPEYDRIYCKRGGYLGDLARFDPLEFGIMPSSVDGGEPDHFLALGVANGALADAGLLNKRFPRERTEVILGRGTYINRGYINWVQHGLVADQTIQILKQLHPEYTEEELQRIKRRLKQSLPPLNAQTVPSLVPNIITGRIANRLDLMGPTYIIDAACASSLIAIEHGMRNLIDGKCDLALVGGVQASISPLLLMNFCEINALSHRSELRPFDKKADGTLLSEGIGIIVLKRLTDAKSNGDKIYALIKGVGVASDGRASGLLAPRMEGEALAIQRAYETADVSPHTVELIEAHGTGTPIGDITEVHALARVFGRQTGKHPICALGTVKSMIGHCLPAAGIAGVIKAALALYHKILPPTLNCDEPNPALELDKTSFYINTEARPWIHGNTDTPRRAGVNAFGFGGINAHCILEEYPKIDTHAKTSFYQRWDSELCILQGESRQNLIIKIEQIQRYLFQTPAVELSNVAYNLNRSIKNGTRRLAIVASSVEELQKKLAYALERLRDHKRQRIKERGGIYYFEKQLCKQGALAFVFPGEGAQYPNMLADLCMHFPEARRCFDLVDCAFNAVDGDFLPSYYIFPQPNGSYPLNPKNAGDELWEMKAAVEAVTSANRAMLELMHRLEIRPQAVVGHSSGEFAALEASGALQFNNDKEIVQCIRNGYFAMKAMSVGGDIPEVALVAVGAVDRARVEALVEQASGSLFVAMENCPHQCILCGPQEVAKATAAQLSREGAICSLLPFNRPYHTPLFAPASRLLRDFFNKLTIISPKIEMYSCATARPYPIEPEKIRALAVQQWTKPVKFQQTIKAMYDAGIRVFIEVGPRGSVTAFINDILRGKPHLAVPANVTRRSGIMQMNHALGLLAAHGASMRLDYLYERRSPKSLDFNATTESLPEERKSAGVKISLTTGIMKLNGTIQKRPRESFDVEEKPEGATSVTNAVPQDSKEIFTQHLQTMEQFLNLEEEVMCEYLNKQNREAEPTELNMGTGISQVEVKMYPDQAGTNSQKQIISQLSVARNHVFPLIGKIISFKPGKDLIAVREFDLDKDIFLLDHTLGTRVSVNDPELTGLPVMPLTMSMEILAEAASLLAPGKVLIGMKNIRAHRWVTFEQKKIAIQIVAQCKSSTPQQEVKVEIRETGNPVSARNVLDLPIAQGTIVFGEQFPPPAETSQLKLRSERLCNLRGAQLYPEGLFHGPAFQGVDSVNRWGEDGAEAVLQVLPTNGLFRSNPNPAFVTDPVLLDAMGQVVGLWAAEHPRAGFVVFPFRLKSLYFYGPKLLEGERCACRARIFTVDETRVLSDIDLIRPDGSLHIRMVGWEDRGFHIPPAFHRFLLMPYRKVLSSPLPALSAQLAKIDVFQCCHIGGFPENFYKGHQKIWQKVLAYLVLNRRERQIWQSMQGTEKRRIDWLLGRAAGKDAVRLFLKQRHGLNLCAADIAIENDEYGKPVVAGAWAEELPQVPCLSLAHSDEVAVAIAGEAVDGGGIGIDVERVRQLDESFLQVACSADERRLLSSLGESSVIEWTVRLWCAKEAAGKALGRGIAGSPKSILAKELDPYMETISLELSGELLQQFPLLSGKRIKAYTLREGDVIIGVAKA
jgi:acyl transferase domain-containing protein/phosphopantetheinyl transferase